MMKLVIRMNTGLFDSADLTDYAAVKIIQIS
jgi:hypothetical protein